MVDKLNKIQRSCVCKMAMAWNPMGNPDIYDDIVKNVTNYFLGNKEALDRVEKKIVDKYILDCEELAKEPNNKVYGHDLSKGLFTKHGHTMFQTDVLKDLWRLAYLERLIENIGGTSVLEKLVVDKAKRNLE